MHKPESDICFFSKSTIVFPKNNIFSKKLNKNNNKNIIKANILVMKKIIKKVLEK